MNNSVEEGDPIPTSMNQPKRMKSLSLP